MGFKEKLEKYKELVEEKEILETRLAYSNYLDEENLQIYELIIGYRDKQGSRRKASITLKGELEILILSTYVKYILALKNKIEELKKQIEELEGGE